MNWSSHFLDFATTGVPRRLWCCSKRCRERDRDLDPLSVEKRSRRRVDLEQKDPEIFTLQGLKSSPLKSYPNPPKKGSLVVFQASIFEGRSVKLLGWLRWLDFVRWFSLVISQDFGVKSGFCAVLGWLHLTANLDCLSSKDLWQDVHILKDFHPLKPKSLHFFEDLRFCFPDGQPQTDPIIHQLPASRCALEAMERFPPEVQDLVRQLKSAGMAIDENNPQDILKAWNIFQ